MSHPIFNRAAFDALGERAQAFQDARPFKHVVVDGLFQPEFLRAVASEYFPAGDPRWQRFKDPSRQVKLALQSEYQLPQHVRELTRELNAEPFLRKLTELTGVEGLIPDPYLEGGGMHQIVRGGKLAIHADFNRQSIMKLDRRLNVLVYLNEDWDEQWGGHLELWDREMKRCEQRIAPLFNRLVVFLTDDFSYHGNPDPLNCPPERVRKSVAMYYYTNGRPAHELNSDNPHSTLFRERPDEVFVDPHPLAVKAGQTVAQADHALRRAMPGPLKQWLKKVLGRP